MKLSQTQNIYEIIKKAGIHNSPNTLSQSELEALSKDPELKKQILGFMSEDNRNFYQELEMDSPFVNTHRDISYAPENLQLHSHSFFEIIYCESGNIQYLIADKRYHIHAGDIILVPPSISHRPIFYEEMTEPYSRIVIWISIEFLRGLISVCPEDVLSKLRSQEHFLLRTEGTSYKYLENYFKQGIKETTTTAPLWELSLYGNTAILLTHLGRALLSVGNSFPIEKREEIDKIITYIEKNYFSKITLESTAKAFHISTSTLGKLFYRKLGISFYQFVTQRRLIHAKLQIEEGYSMEETAP